MSCSSPMYSMHRAGEAPRFVGRPSEQWLRIVGGEKEFSLVGCGRCRSCRQAKALEWSFRCWLEARDHEDSCWCTVTYADEYVPHTLSTVDFVLFVKRFREQWYRERGHRPRFFGCGEYGERRGRPHFHVIWFGVSNDATTRQAIAAAWNMGRTQVDDISDASMAYVAGYCSKKLADSGAYARRDVVDPDTGEVLGAYQPPFIRQSRRPGIGGWARKYVNSWEDKAVFTGVTLPVPRYFNEAWKKEQTPEVIQAHAEKKAEFRRMKSLDQLQVIARRALMRDAKAVSRRTAE